jgi:hypothetical protein
MNEQRGRTGAGRTEAALSAQVRHDKKSDRRAEARLNEKAQAQAEEAEQRTRYRDARDAAVTQAVADPSPHKLCARNEMVRDISLPGDLMPAFSSGRTELLSLWVPRPLTEEEAVALVGTLKTLLETNRALVDHNAETAEKVRNLRKTVQGLGGLVGRLDDVVNFRPPIDDDDQYDG